MFEFEGEAWLSADAKGRIIIPVKFRDMLGSKFHLTKGFDNCLQIYPEEEWAVFKEKVSKLPQTDKSVRKFVRKYIGGAYAAELDTQFRTIIPQNLRDHAGINKEVVLVGTLGKLELWSAENYRIDEADELDDDMIAKIADFGI